MTKSLVPAHGNRPDPQPLLVADPAERRELLREAAALPRVRMDSRETSDVVMLATGAFTPLDGFVGRADYVAILDGMHLSSGTLWPIPVTLAGLPGDCDPVREGDRVALVDPDRDEIMAVMNVREKFPADKKREVRAVFGTDDPKHPGVQKVLAQPGVYLGGPVQVLSEGEYPERFPAYARCAETRALFAEKGWATVVAFQTRNPIHRSHEYLIRVALDIADGVFIHPIVGKLKEGDIPADVRMKCYDALIDNYLPRKRVVLRVYPMEMRYAGPKEAILHGIIRQNFGCSHLIVGRDHAGVGKYYGPFDAQKIFDDLAPDDLHLRPLKLDWTFWCHRCDAIVSAASCPHPDSDHLMISGTELRNMLSLRRRPPEQFSRPEVVEILMDYYSKQTP